jgi:hypothetical protein
MGGILRKLCNLPLSALASPHQVGYFAAKNSSEHPRWLVFYGKAVAGSLDHPDGMGARIQKGFKKGSAELAKD